MKSKRHDEEKPENSTMPPPHPDLLKKYPALDQSLQDNRHPWNDSDWKDKDTWGDSWDESVD